MGGMGGEGGMPAGMAEMMAKMKGEATVYGKINLDFCFFSRCSLACLSKSISLAESSKPSILVNITIRALFQGFPANLSVATGDTCELFQQ